MVFELGRKYITNEGLLERTLRFVYRRLLDQRAESEETLLIIDRVALLIGSLVYHLRGLFSLDGCLLRVFRLYGTSNLRNVLI
jgi:hypothetical protein